MVDVPVSRLSPRETDVLQRLASGHSARRIASDLKIRYWTVYRFRANIGAKLLTTDLSDLTRYAIRHGLVSPAD